MQVRGLDHVTHHVRAAATFAPGRPAVWLGLRTATATALALALATWLGPVAATWAPLAGFGVCLVDRGGAYRTRATRMAIAAIGSLLAVTAGSLVAGTGVVAVVVVTVGLALCALAQAWGIAGASIGNTIALQLIVAAALPLGAGELGDRLAGFGLGAGLALVLSLGVWPVRVHKPGRRAIAAVLTGLAEHAALLARGDAHGPGWRDAAIVRHRALRARLEVARATLAATRRRPGATDRGERLLAIAQLCDPLFGLLTALEEVIDAGVAPTTRPVIVDGLERLAGALDELAGRILVERRQAAPASPAWRAPPVDEPRAIDRAHAEHALQLLTRAHRSRLLISDLIDSLVDDVDPVGPRLPAPEPTPGVVERLRGLLDLDRASPILRHALRVAVAALVASSIAGGLRLANGYWVTLATYLLLQPHRAATTTRTIQRGAGTVAGGIVAAAILWGVRDPLAVMAIVVVLAGLSASVLQLNHLLFAMLVTPTFVLLTELQTLDHSLLGVRVANTLLGGAIALVAGALLWPGREEVRLRERAAVALETLGRYLGAVVEAAAADTPPPSPQVLACRRRFGLALEDAELALERVLAERTPSAQLEPWMTLLAFARRLAGAVNGLGSARAVIALSPDAPAIAGFARAVQARLDQLAAAVRAGVAPPPAAPLDAGVGAPLVEARLARIAVPLTALGDAAARAARS